MFLSHVVSVRACHTILQVLFPTFTAYDVAYYIYELLKGTPGIHFISKQKKAWNIATRTE